MAKKILIIDDDIDLVDSIVTLLDAKGYQVEKAFNGEEGIALAKQTMPDLILLDVMMTTRDEGFNIARELKAIEESKEIPIVMISGVRQEMNLPFGFEPDESWLPIKQFLEKPVKPDVLLKAVEEHTK